MNKKRQHSLETGTFLALLALAGLLAALIGCQTLHETSAEHLEELTVQGSQHAPGDEESYVAEEGLTQDEINSKRMQT